MDFRQYRKRIAHLKRKPEFSLSGAELDPSEQFIISKAAGFLLRSLSPACLSESSCYDVLTWILGCDTKEVAAFMADKLPSQHIERWREELSALKPDPYVCSDVFRHIRQACIPEVISFVSDSLNKRIEKLASELPSELELKLQSLQKLFNLKTPEIDLCLFTFIMSANSSFRGLMKSDLECTKYANRNLLAKILGVPKHELVDMFSGTLCKCRLCTVDTDNIEMGDSLVQYLCGVSKDYCPEALFRKGGL